jgi:hypothetical protein
MKHGGPEANHNKVFFILPPPTHQSGEFISTQLCMDALANQFTYLNILFAVIMEK